MIKLTGHDPQLKMGNGRQVGDKDTKYNRKTIPK